ncbi:C4-dicarboxylate ABC transporter [Rhodococcus sp. 14-2496-1d]|uniref:SLC13 family permease n=1 Tax=Rhodococcus sp. 14-2496-1d TaxID=2023146 RepID=UPI000B9A1E3B|nr:SLC13 family permease [Rhodococcus sp. 14-2496-1d]OZF25692.1 C4-dicarboxylate ABC transporter [Rhodococcus sp. 14-2496-1d]
MVYAISFIVLAIIFAVGTTTTINMGVLAFAAAFIVGAAVSGIPVADIIDAFPGSTFLIVFGITLMFAIAKSNGTIDLITHHALKVVRDKPKAILWMMFALSALLMSLGSVLAAGILAPVAMPLAARYRIKPFLMAAMLAHGAFAGALSPVNMYGAFVNGLVSSSGFTPNPGLMYIVPFVLNLALAVIVFAIFGRGVGRTEVEGTGSESSGSGGSASTTGRPAPEGGVGGGSGVGGGVGLETKRLQTVQVGTEVPLNPVRLATLIGILALVLGSVFFGLDVGVSSLCISAALLLLTPKAYPKVLDSLPWPTIAMVSGMLTYMAVLQQNGTLDLFGEAASSLGSPILTALVLCIAVAIVSAFGSSLGTLGVVLPLAAPLLVTGEVNVVIMVAALGFCATVVDVTPFGAATAMTIASADEKDRLPLQRKMLAYCGVMVVVSPLLVWGLGIVPTAL